MITLGEKLKLQKKVPKTTLNLDYSCPIQKTAPKNDDYSKNESILKIDNNGQYAKAIIITYGKKLKLRK